MNSLTGMIDEAHSNVLWNTSQGCPSDPGDSQPVMTQMPIPEGIQEFTPQEAWQDGYIAGQARIIARVIAALSEFTELIEDDSE